MQLIKPVALLRAPATLLSSTARHYAFKSDLKIKWVRPERILCIKPAKSGDQAAFPAIEKDKYLLDYQNSDELKTANEHVQRLFQLGFNPKKRTTEYYSNDLTNLVKRHQLDLGSMESKLATMTATIRRLQEQMEKFPHNKRMLVVCKELIDRRKKFLRHLRCWDYKRFEWVLEKLDLVYKAYPSEYHWITRKESLVKLTNIHCESIQNERLTEYRRQLEAQQMEFLEKKLQNLEFIRQEQLDCNVAVTVSPDDIKTVRDKYNELKQKQSVA